MNNLYIMIILSFYINDLYDEMVNSTLDWCTLIPNHIVLSAPIGILN